MIAAGIKVGGLEDGAEGEQPKKKPESKKRSAGRRQEKVSARSCSVQVGSAGELFDVRDLC